MDADLCCDAGGFLFPAFVVFCFPNRSLSKAQVKGGFAILNEIQAILNEVDESGSNDATDLRLMDASNRFYSVIPHTFGVRVFVGVSKRRCTATSHWWWVVYACVVGTLRATQHQLTTAVERKDRFDAELDGSRCRFVAHEVCSWFGPVQARRQLPRSQLWLAGIGTRQ